MAGCVEGICRALVLGLVLIAGTAIRAGSFRRSRHQNYKKQTQLGVPTTPTVCGGTSSSVKRSENWSHPIPFIGLRKRTISLKAAVI